MPVEGEGKKRIGVFVTPEFSRWIKLAASRVGQTQNRFITQAVYEKIKAMLEKDLQELAEAFYEEIIPPAGVQKKQEPEPEETEDCNE